MQDEKDTAPIVPETGAQEMQESAPVSQWVIQDKPATAGNGPETEKAAPAAPVFAPWHAPKDEELKKFFDSKKGRDGKDAGTPDAQSFTKPGMNIPFPQINTGTLVVGIIIGLVVAFSVMGTREYFASQGQGESVSDGAKAAPATNTLDTSTKTSPSLVETDHSADTIVIPTVQEAGMIVSIAQIDAQSPVWAVVYENDGGKPGRILGAGRFTPERTSGTVDLIRTTLPNLSYFVGLAADSEDRSFSADTNKPIVDASGVRVLAQFVAQ